MIGYIAILVIIALAVMWRREYQLHVANPDSNCLNDWFCPLRSGLGWAKSEDAYRERAARQNDTVTADGRLEHVTYPAPDPAAATYRNLFN